MLSQEFIAPSLSWLLNWPAKNGKRNFEGTLKRHNFATANTPRENRILQIWERESSRELELTEAHHLHSGKLCYSYISVEKHEFEWNQETHESKSVDRPHCELQNVGLLHFLALTHICPTYWWLFLVALHYLAAGRITHLSLLLPSVHGVKNSFPYLDLQSYEWLDTKIPLLSSRHFFRVPWPLQHPVLEANTSVCCSNTNGASAKLFFTMLTLIEA